MQYRRKIAPPERFFMFSPFSIVTMVIRIKGYVSLEMLEAAVGRVQQRHTLLGVRIEAVDNIVRWFNSEEVQAIPIAVVPRESTDDWIAVHSAALKTPFEFDTHPAIRFILVQSPEKSELIILCHHMICDGMSLAYLARDLMVHLGEQEREADVLPAQAPIDLENLPADVSQSFIVKFLIERMNRQWAQERVMFDQEDYRALTRAYWGRFQHRLFSIELSESETSGLIARCRKEKVTVNSALTAAFSGAQSYVQGKQPSQEKIVVAANLRDRIPEQPGQAMGMYAGGVELKFIYDHKKGFWENARNFNHKIQPMFTNKNLFSEILNWLYLDATIFEAMHFKKLGGLVPQDSARYEKLSTFSRRDDVVLRLLKRDHLDSLDTKYWGTAVTNLGRLEFPQQFGSLELERLILQPGGGIPLVNANLVLGAVTCVNKLSLVVEYAEQAVDTSTMDAIQAQAMRYLLGTS